MVFLLLILFFLPFGSCSSALRTSLCCCGCTDDPCPVVGPTCADPRSLCDTNMDGTVVQCYELQRLWNLALMARENGSLQPEEIPKESPSFPSPSFTPFLNEQGIPYTLSEHDNGGQQEWGETIYQSIPPDLPPQFHPPIFIPIDEEQKIPLKDFNTSSFEIRFSPQRKDSTITKIESSTGDEDVDQFTAIEKLEGAISELKQMISTVKKIMSTKAPLERKEKEEGESKQNALISEKITDQLEQKAIDDIIQRMRGSFVKVSKGEDSKPKRDEKDNCNDLKLKEIIVKNIGSDAKTSKRAIQKAAEEILGGTFNVICSPCEFSFVISSQKYCEGFHDQVACFAFLQPPTTAGTN
uniref:Ground-like domain-containing protein n=1 Tax=Heterorhabditis bacteriophora TaxID=37862 RepID=A0A1I7XL30_HETBA